MQADEAAVGQPGPRPCRAEARGGGADARRAPRGHRGRPGCRPVIRRFETQRPFCPRYRKMVRSPIPSGAPQRRGPPGAVWARALALAADLRRRLGLSFRKVADVFQTHFGVRMSPGPWPRLAIAWRPGASRCMAGSSTRRGPVLRSLSMRRLAHRRKALLADPLGPPARRGARPDRGGPGPAAAVSADRPRQRATWRASFQLIASTHWPS